MSEAKEKTSMLDRAIRYVSPQAGLKRDLARVMRNQHITTDSSGKLTMSVPYSAAYQSRVDSYWALSMSMTGVREINRFNLRRMRDRARQLERDNVLACAILDRVTDNVIGPGLRLLPTTDDAGFNTEATDLWDDWKASADITGRMSFEQLQWMIYRSHVRDGDVGAVLVSRGDDAFLQAISGDYIDSLSGAILDNTTNVHGMELGADGRPVQYHIKSADDTGWWKETIIPARNMVFFARMKQLMDYRGEPLFAPIFSLLEQMDGYRDSEIIKKRIEACQALFIKSAAAVPMAGALSTTTNAHGNRVPVTDFEPGQVRYLQPGEEAIAFNPSQSSQSFQQMMRTLEGYLGLNCGLTWNMLMLDYTGMSYTAGKMGTLQSHHHFRIQQTRFVQRALDRIYHWRLSKFVKAGILRVPRPIADSYWRHKWIAPGFPLLDPRQEVLANMALIDGAMASWSDMVLSAGHNPESLADRIARDREMLKSHGIEPSKSSMTRDPLPPAVPGAPGAGLVLPASARTEDDGEDS